MSTKPKKDVQEETTRLERLWRRDDEHRAVTGIKQALGEIASTVEPFLLTEDFDRSYWDSHLSFMEKDSLKRCVLTFLCEWGSILLGVPRGKDSLNMAGLSHYRRMVALAYFPLMTCVVGDSTELSAKGFRRAIVLDDPNQQMQVVLQWIEVRIRPRHIEYVKSVLDELYLGTPAIFASAHRRVAQWKEEES